MTTFTVFGDCGGPGTTAATYTRSGLLAGARSYRELSLELPDRVPVDLAHDAQHEVGQLVYAELDDERLRCVAVVHGLDLDQAAEEGERIYFSPSLEITGPMIDQRETYIANDATLLAVALTTDTARLGARPVSWLPGDVRSQVDRRRWSALWRSDHPLLEHALDHLQGFGVVGLETRAATHVVNRRPLPVDGYLDYGWQLREGDPAPPHLQRPRGGLRHGPPGKVLRVR
jgi:hypothetical protein